MTNIWSIVGVVMALQVFLIASALSAWAKIRGLLANEAIVLERLSDPKEANDETSEAFFNKPGIKGSLLHSRWIAINELVEFTGNTPVDQSFLDEEIESDFEDAIAPLRAKAGIAVLIGLGGTLTGLTVGVQNLHRALPQPGEQIDLNKFSGPMGETMSGFGAAFYSALAGVLTAILLGALASHLQGSSSAFLQKFRICCRSRLIRLLPQNANRTVFLEQLNVFAKSLKSLDRRLPDLEMVQETLEKVQDASSSLEDSTKAAIGAYERSIRALERPNTISEGLLRLEVLLTEHTQRTEAIIQKALGAVEQAAKKQTEMSEEVARLIVDAPLEVASARLVVTDRPEFQRMQLHLEQRIDRMDHSVKETKATMDKIAERGNILTRLIKRLKH